MLTSTLPSSKRAASLSSLQQTVKEARSSLHFTQLVSPKSCHRSEHIIIGSAEALPILCVSDFCERERERETPVTSLISRWNREWSCTWLLRRRVDPTRRRVLTLTVERSNFEVHACKDKELGAWALDWAAGSSDWWTTMGKWKLCVRWSDYCGSPSSISLACFKQEEKTKLMFISFSNGHGSTFENSLDSGYSFASVPARCRKTTLLEAW